MSDDILSRILELIKEDVLLHNAVLRLLEAKRDAEKARQRWYDRRAKEAEE